MLVLDKKRFPRDKPCGGGIRLRGLPALRRRRTSRLRATERHATDPRVPHGRPARGRRSPRASWTSCVNAPTEPTRASLQCGQRGDGRVRARRPARRDAASTAARWPHGWSSAADGVNSVVARADRSSRWLRGAAAGDRHHGGDAADSSWRWPERATRCSVCATATRAGPGYGYVFPKRRLRRRRRRLPAAVLQADAERRALRAPRAVPRGAWRAPSASCAAARTPTTFKAYRCRW